MTTWNVIEILDQAFVLTQLLGLAKTKAEFSEKLLGKGASYLSSMSARDRCPSRDVLLVLEDKLLTLLAAHNGSTDSTMQRIATPTQFSVRLKRVYEFVKAARLVHEAFADDFYPENEIRLPVPEHSAIEVARSYWTPFLNEDVLAQPKQMEGGR